MAQAQGQSAIGDGRLAVVAGGGQPSVDVVDISKRDHAILVMPGYRDDERVGLGDQREAGRTRQRSRRQRSRVDRLIAFEYRDCRGRSVLYQGAQ